MSKPRYIEWTDKRGVRNVFDTVPLTFPAFEPIPPHTFAPHRYLNGHEQIVSTSCSWCKAFADHPIHNESTTA